MLPLEVKRSVIALPYKKLGLKMLYVETPPTGNIEIGTL